MSHPPHSQDVPPAGGLDDAGRAAYWARNVRLLTAHLLVWAAVSYGAGVLLRPWRDRFTLPGTGFPLGFWFAQQGSILVFVVLVFSYSRRMNKLDREFGVEED